MFPSAPLDVNPHAHAHAHARSRSLSLARSPTALTSSSLFFPHDRRPSHIAAAATTTTHEAHELGVVQPPPLLRRPSQLYKVVERPGSEDDGDAEALKGGGRDASRESERGRAVGLEDDLDMEMDMEMDMLMVGGEDEYQYEYEYDGPFEKPDRREMLWMVVSALVVLSLAGMAFLTTIYNWVL